MKKILATTLGFAAFYEKAFAETVQITITNPLACGDINCFLSKITNFVLFLAAPIASIMVLVGGFMMITAGGDPEKFSKGKKTLLYAAIGFVVVLLANAVAPLIESLFK